MHLSGRSQSAGFRVRDPTPNLALRVWVQGFLMVV